MEGLPFWLLRKGNTNKAHTPKQRTSTASVCHFHTGALHT